VKESLSECLLLAAVADVPVFLAIFWTRFGPLAKCRSGNLALRTLFAVHLD